MNYKKYILFIIITVGILFFNKISLAQTGTYGTDTKENMDIFAHQAQINQEDENLQEKIIQYINVLLSFVGLIFLVLIIISGVKWMTSGGQEEIINKSKAIIKSSIIGILIIFGSWVIANGIIQIILKGGKQHQGIYGDWGY